MHDLGDEIFLDSFRIPWLIWIQLLILLLLILLLSYSGLFSLDLLPAGSPPPSPVSSASVVVDALSCSQSQGRDPEVHEPRPRESTERESITEGNASSMKDLHRLFHPCYYFEIAKQAFLQCLGLGYPPPNSRERRHDE